MTNWSSRAQGYLGEVTAAVADRLVSMNTEVIPVNERITKQEIPHILGVYFSSLRVCADWDE